MKNKKGFTLIELLAVIVILGLLMAIAIPSVTKYITESRKKTVVSTIGNYITAMVNEVNDLTYTFTGDNTIYAVPVECIALERGGTNPFGAWHQANDAYWAYVLVQYDDETSSYRYGYTFKDSAGYGLYPTTQAKLNEGGKQIQTGLDLNRPKTGKATVITAVDNWSGFSIDSSTDLVVLKSEVEGNVGDGISTCTLQQKGDNYDQVEEEKNNGGGSEEDGNDEITVTCTSTENCTWEEIKVISDDGKADEYFSLGDTKKFTTTNGKTITMEIVAFNSDDKADKAEKASITWIAKDIVITHVMNPTMTNTHGWKNSEMRAWLHGEFYDTIPEEVIKVIVPVRKTYLDYTTKTTLSSNDIVWIPSQHEIFGTSTIADGYETSGVDYTEFFSSPASRVKYDSNGAATAWFLRSADSRSTTSFLSVIPMSMMGGGFSSSNYANSAYGVALGFCT